MKVISKDNIHKVKATVTNSWQLDWWIKSQGSLIEVLKPLSIRKKIKKELEKTLANY
jgi:predicted DNA-binding transcriptional regulator YafY